MRLRPPSVVFRRFRQGLRLEFAVLTSYCTMLFSSVERAMRIQVNNPIVQLLLKIIGWKCWCRKTTRIFNDNEGYYVRCLQCGRRMPYDWAALGTINPSQRIADAELEAAYNCEPQRSWLHGGAVDSAG